MPPPPPLPCKNPRWVLKRRKARWARRSDMSWRLVWRVWDPDLPTLSSAAGWLLRRSASQRTFYIFNRVRPYVFIHVKLSNFGRTCKKKWKIKKNTEWNFALEEHKSFNLLVYSDSGWHSSSSEPDHRELCLASLSDGGERSTLEAPSCPHQVFPRRPLGLRLWGSLFWLLVKLSYLIIIDKLVRPG